MVVYESFELYNALTGKICPALDKWSLTGGGCLREVVAHRGSTVSSNRCNLATAYIQEWGGSGKIVPDATLDVSIDNIDFNKMFTLWIQTP